MATLTPILTGTPGHPPSYNVGMAETFSWVPIDNDVNRPLFARASYITNLKDLSISLSASDIHIGGVELTDGTNHNITATIAQLGNGRGNALQIIEMRPVSAVNISNTVAVSGSVTLTNTVTAVSVINDVQVHASSTFPVSGSVTITNPVTAISTTLTEEAGDLFAFNNHAAAIRHGWYMDDVMRPMISIQNSSANAADLVKVIEYQIANNNNNTSTIMYEWYEGPLTLSGAAIPSWTTTGNRIQYRVYQDLTNSNTGNTFTVPAGTYLRHSGMIVGKNIDADEGPATLKGGSSRNMLTLCVKRLDSGTELDVWFAFTCKELS